MGHRDAGQHTTYAAAALGNGTYALPTRFLLGPRRRLESPSTVRRGARQARTGFGAGELMMHMHGAAHRRWSRGAAVGVACLVLVGSVGVLTADAYAATTPGPPTVQNV